MRLDIFKIILFGYGLGLEYKKSIGKITQNGLKPKKFHTNININEFSDWHFAVRYRGNYALVLRIYLNR